VPVAFDQLGLTPDLLRTVAAEGYTEPTPVQAQSIPVVLAGRDLLAGAQTGTGKTAAFVLPILQLLHASRPSVGTHGGRPRRGETGLPIRCLVLTPTRELALQIEESVRTYGAARPVASTTIYGGVGFQPQVRALRAGPEIVVATPGRLLDHVGQGTIDLSSVQILVLDEADRMLDMGFIRDIRRILSLIPERRQNLLFSATFSDEIRDLAAGFLHDPVHVQIARRNAPIELVRQVVYPVDRVRKRELLSHLIRSGRIDRALVFTRTKHGANRLAEQLGQDGILAAAIHGNKSQGQRVRALDDFKAGRVAILVATEIAARGLDIDGLPHVVNFELPMVPQDYVHRIGRTGRAGMEGDAVSLVCVDEDSLLDDIQHLLRMPIRREVVPGFEVNRSIAREPIRQRSEGISRPSFGRAPSRPRIESRPAAGRWPNGSAPAASPRAANGGFNTSLPVEPRRAPMGAYRRPTPSDFSRSEHAPRASAGPRSGAGRPSAPRHTPAAPRPSAAGTSIGYAPSLRPALNAVPGSRHGSQFRPPRNSGNRPQDARASTDGNRPGDRREHPSMPGERIARSGTRSA
jgi:ATP-dependent RNA helicase RhlE